MFFFTYSHALINPFYPTIFCISREDDTKTHANLQCRQTETHTSSHTPFLEEMSLARSSLRLARESASSSARGKAFSWGAERLCWTWDSSKVWVSASSRATQHRQGDAQAADDIKTYCEIKERACCLLGTCLCLRGEICTFRGSRDRALALLKELGGEGEPETARTQDCQHDTHTQPCSHLKHRERRERGAQGKFDKKEFEMPSCLGLQPLLFNSQRPH